MLFGPYGLPETFLGPQGRPLTRSSTLCPWVEPRAALGIGSRFLRLNKGDQCFEGIKTQLFPDAWKETHLFHVAQEDPACKALRGGLVTWGTQRTHIITLLRLSGIMWKSIHVYPLSQHIHTHTHPINTWSVELQPIMKGPYWLVSTY